MTTYIAIVLTLYIAYSILYKINYKRMVNKLLKGEYFKYIDTFNFKAHTKRYEIEGYLDDNKDIQVNLKNANSGIKL